MTVFLLFICLSSFVSLYMYITFIHSIRVEAFTATKFSEILGQTAAWRLGGFTSWSNSLPENISCPCDCLYLSNKQSPLYSQLVLL